jgi:riboflavin kinase/FMN adenylyltransferase
MAPLLLKDPSAFPAALRGGVLCVGNFDGVHAGHAKMLETGKAEAVRRGGSFSIMTFDPHPATVLRPGVKRVPLTLTEQRVELLAGFGADVILMIEPTREFLGITAQDFLRDVVEGALGARVMVEGPTFTFGRGAKGTVEMLQREGGAYGIGTIVVPTQQVGLSDMTLVNVSSSLTRWLVEHGRVVDAWKCLKRPFTLRGEVVKGQQRGKAIGFPTANLQTSQLLPAAGIYAGVAVLRDGRRLKAAISVGDNPTFHGAVTTVEAFLLDFDGDLYGQVIDLEFHRWLREMWAFSGVGPLVKRIEKDVAEVREMTKLE